MNTLVPADHTVSATVAMCPPFELRVQKLTAERHSCGTVLPLDPSDQTWHQYRGMLGAPSPDAGHSAVRKSSSAEQIKMSRIRCPLHPSPDVARDDHSTSSTGRGTQGTCRGHSERSGVAPAV